MKLKLCPYRFALESIEQGRTIFRDRFLIHSYLKILIGNSVKKKLNGKPYSDEIIKKTIQEEFEVIEVRFRISDELEKTQIISSVYKEIYGYLSSMKKHNKNKNTFPIISSQVDREMHLKEHFLNISLKEMLDIPKDEEVKQALIDKKFYCKHGKHCLYCASKDICLEYGANTGGE